MRKQVTTSIEHSQLVALLPRLKRYALSLAGSVSDGEDLLHSTIERALAKADQFSVGTNLDRWMFRICKNLWMDEWRTKKRRSEDQLSDAPHMEPSMDGERHATISIQLAELTQTLSRLQDDHREILMLVVVEGYSYKEVSSMLNIPIGTVMSRLARARQRLCELIPVPASESNNFPLNKGSEGVT